MPRYFKGERIFFSTQVTEQLDSHMGKKRTLALISYSIVHEINSKWNTDLNISVKTMAQPLWKSLIFLQKVKYKSNHMIQYSTPRYISKRMKTKPQKNCTHNALNSISHNSQKVEIT